jgi:hypothetical protein
MPKKYGTTGWSYPARFAFIQGHIMFGPLMTTDCLMPAYEMDLYKL